MGLTKTPTFPQTPAAANVENATAAQVTPATQVKPAVESAPAVETAAQRLQDTSVAAEDIPDDVLNPEPIQHQPAVTQATQGGGLQVAGADDDGFGALDGKMSYGAFPIFKLDKTSFMLGSKDIGSEAHVKMKGARPKLLYKEKGKQETKHLFYTYDHLIHGTGSSVPATLAQWKAEGIEWEVKEYMEVICMMQVKDANGVWQDNGVALASIPPASVSRLSGYRFEVKSLLKQALSDVVTRCFVGDKVTFGKTTFHPWNFELAQ